MSTLVITFIILASLVSALVIYWLFSNKEEPPSYAEKARIRARERMLESMYMDTQPNTQEFTIDMSLNGVITTELDDKVNGYADLSDEQKAVIRAVFDKTPEDIKLDGTLRGDAWTHAVFGDLNRIGPINTSNV